MVELGTRCTTERVQIGNSLPTVVRAAFLSRQPHAAFDVAGAGNVTMGELCTHLTIERVRLETLALKCARQFSTLPEGGRWKSTHRGNSLAVYPTSRPVLRRGEREQSRFP